MSRSARILTLGLAAALIPVAMGSAPPGDDLFSGQATAPPAKSQEAAESEKALAGIKAEIAALRLKIQEANAREMTTLSEIDRLGLSRNLLRRELDLQAVELGLAREERAALLSKIPVIEAEAARRRDDLARVLVALYKFGRFDMLRFALQAKDLQTFISETRPLAELVAAERRKIVEAAESAAALRRAAADLAGKEKEIEALIARGKETRAALDAEERQDRELVARINAGRQSYEKTAEELGLRARDLQRLLAGLPSAEAGLPFPLIPFEDKRGKLPWPLAGRILQRFGLQRHPQFDTVTMNNGIEIAPPLDRLAVQAVHTGRVAYADFFQGYGNLVILDHGRSYHTLYGHLSAFRVKPGDTVTVGQPIADAGDTSSLLGTSLYFQISHQAKPLDPLPWLGRR